MFSVDLRFSLHYTLQVFYSEPISEGHTGGMVAQRSFAQLSFCSGQDSVILCSGINGTQVKRHSPVHHSNTTRQHFFSLQHWTGNHFTYWLVTL